MKSIKINLKSIKALNPCKDRFDNYIKFYGDKSFTKAQFMGLNNITHLDKLWVVFKSMPKENLRFAAADIAESVLHIFETKYPEDLRPRKAIEAAKRGGGAARAAANAATHAVNANAAAYAANAANAANTSAHAANAAAYAANAAAYAAGISDNSRQVQEKLIRKILMKYWG